MSTCHETDSGVGNNSAIHKLTAPSVHFLPLSVCRSIAARRGSGAKLSRVAITALLSDKQEGGELNPLLGRVHALHACHLKRRQHQNITHAY